jgi:fido (protein-threonine AMPylation protein)
VQQRYFSLLADVKAWVEFGTYPPDEVCVRFHHALVVVPPWRKGNGRHARLIADRLAVGFGNPPFTWGGGLALEVKGDTRELYLAAMKQADHRDFAPLMTFARG